MRIALWNANGLAQHKSELELFLKQQQIDVMLISETHFTDKNYLKIHGYNFYHTQHPSGKAHGGTGIIIKSNIKHYELPPFQKDYLQATNVAIEDCHGTITTSAGGQEAFTTGQEANLEKTYLREIKAIKGKTKKTLLAHGPTLQTKHTEQNNPPQGRNKTCLDLRNPTMGNSK